MYGRMLVSDVECRMSLGDDAGFHLGSTHASTFGRRETRRHSIERVGRGVVAEQVGGALVDTADLIDEVIPATAWGQAVGRVDPQFDRRARRVAVDREPVVGRDEQGRSGAGRPVDADRDILGGCLSELAQSDDRQQGHRHGSDDGEDGRGACREVPADPPAGTHGRRHTSPFGDARSGLEI